MEDVREGVREDVRLQGGSEGGIEGRGENIMLQNLGIVLFFMLTICANYALQIISLCSRNMPLCLVKQ